MTDKKATARKWGVFARERAGRPATNWLESPLVQQLVVHPAFHGQQSPLNWLDAIAAQHFPRPVPRAVSLGCGDGGLERQAAELGVADKLLGLDLSPDAVAVAQQHAADAGLGQRIAYAVCDLDRLTLQPGSCDAVLAAMSLHHVRELERVLDQVRAALRPGGLLVLNEYVGPSRLQWTLRQLALANLLLAIMPLRLRRGIETSGFKWAVWRPPLRTLRRDDPSEAVRAAEIPALVAQRFEVVQRIDYGGAVFLPLLQGIAGNLDQSRELDQRIVRRVAWLERTGMRDGWLNSDFSVIVATAR